MNSLALTKEAFHNKINIDNSTHLVVTQMEDLDGRLVQVSFVDDHRQCTMLLASYNSGYWNHPNQESRDWFWYYAKHYNKSLSRILKTAIKYDETKVFLQKWLCFRRKLNIKYTKAHRKLNEALHNALTIY